MILRIIKNMYLYLFILIITFINLLQILQLLIYLLNKLTSICFNLIVWSYGSKKNWINWFCNIYNANFASRFDGTVGTINWCVINMTKIKLVLYSDIICLLSLFIDWSQINYTVIKPLTTSINIAVNRIKAIKYSFFTFLVQRIYRLQDRYRLTNVSVIDYWAAININARMWPINFTVRW